MCRFTTKVLYLNSSCSSSSLAFSSSYFSLLVVLELNSVAIFIVVFIVAFIVSICALKLSNSRNLEISSATFSSVAWVSLLCCPSCSCCPCPENVQACSHPPHPHSEFVSSCASQPPRPNESSLSSAFCKFSLSISSVKVLSCRQTPDSLNFFVWNYFLRNLKPCYILHQIRIKSELENLTMVDDKSGNLKKTFLDNILILPKIKKTWADFFLFFSSFTLNSHFSVKMSFFQVSIYMSLHFQILRMIPIQT